MSYDRLERFRDLGKAACRPADGVQVRGSRATGTELIAELRRLRILERNALYDEIPLMCLTLDVDGTVLAVKQPSSVSRSGPQH